MSSRMTYANIEHQSLFTAGHATPIQAPTPEVVTLAELSVGPLVATTDEERAARQAHLQAAEPSTLTYANALQAIDFLRYAFGFEVRW
jgi:hypothetical protein